MFTGLITDWTVMLLMSNWSEKYVLSTACKGNEIQATGLFVLINIRPWKGMHFKHFSVLAD